MYWKMFHNPILESSISDRDGLGTVKMEERIEEEDSCELPSKEKSSELIVFKSEKERFII